jgi:CelD/BcsL family acetyltransferase involved in cellulose biosynthesis
MPVTYQIDSGETRCPRLRTVIQRTPQVFELDPLSDPRWKIFVDSHPDASVFHRVEWLRALNSCYGYMPAALTLSHPESPLENGLLLCEVRSRLTGCRLVSIPFSDHCEPLISGSEELDLFVAHLAKRKEEEHWKYFELRPILHTLDEQQRIGISQNYHLHRLDLRPSLQTLYKQFHKDSVQRKIRRAEREGLRYEEGNSETLLQHFYKLMIMTRKRQGLPPQPLRWFRAVLGCMGTNAQIRVAWKGETPIASILTLRTPRTLVYKYGCSDRRFSNLGGTALLFWNAIRRAKAEGLEELDFGRSDIANTGLITFKEHWGAERRAVNYWRYPVKAASSNPESLIKYAKQLISISPDRVLVMLGNLFYPHVG